MACGFVSRPSRCLRVFKELNKPVSERNKDGVRAREKERVGRMRIKTESLREMIAENGPGLHMLQTTPNTRTQTVISLSVS